MMHADRGYCEIYCSRKDDKEQTFLDRQMEERMVHEFTWGEKSITKKQEIYRKEKGAQRNCQGPATRDRLLRGSSAKVEIGT